MIFQRNALVWGGVAQWIGRRISDQGVPGSILHRCTFRCGLEQVTITLCLVLVKSGSGGRTTWTDCGEAGDYVVPNVLSPRDLVSRPDILDKTVPHTKCTVRAAISNILYAK